jgi:hypothetical protein
VPKDDRADGPSNKAHKEPAAAAVSCAAVSGEVIKFPAFPIYPACSWPNSTMVLVHSSMQ